jgi:hypothetical protein
LSCITKVVQIVQIPSGNFLFCLNEKEKTAIVVEEMGLKCFKIYVKKVKRNVKKTYRQPPTGQSGKTTMIKPYGPFLETEPVSSDLLHTQ